MWTYFPHLLATPAPRYTSYPTAADFADRVGPDEYVRALQQAEGDVSLYVHLPFCEKICWYCGCNTSAANNHNRLQSYLDALHAEIALVASRLPPSARIRRVSFGGGSPNAISPVDFVRLLHALTIAFGLDRPLISVELDPRTLDDAWGEVIGGIGIARASLGVQTLAPHLQAAIGRIQPEDMIVRATAILRRAGVASLNFDLMYGLPGQSEADVAESLEKAVDMGADRIALFGYAHVPHMIARQQKIDATRLPGTRERFAMAALGHDLLLARGYWPVGFDHFARPADPLAQAAVNGALHRNFQGFTDDDAPVLVGLGASAISSFPDLLVQNEKNAGRYRMALSQGRLTACRGIARSADDRRRGAIIEALLCRGRARIDPESHHDIKARLAPFARHGLVSISEEWVEIAPAGLPYARGIAARFDSYRETSPQKFSSAV